MLTGNKGEWSEIYVLLKLLGEGVVTLTAGEPDESSEEELHIVKIIRKESGEETKEYTIGENIVVHINGKKEKELPAEEFKKESENLLRELETKKLSGAFSVGRTQKFLDEIFVCRLSAPATDKCDITISVADKETGQHQTLGFSIKSELGNSPTLLNAGKTTNIIYKIINCTKETVKEVNKICLFRAGEKHIDVRGRIKELIDKKGKLEYREMNNKAFSENLSMIDSSMDVVIAETVLYFYRDGIVNCDEMVEKLEKENPMHYINVKEYRSKFKKFLMSAALGMKPATFWDGAEEVNGGYIVVTREGNLLAYHLRNRNSFGEYLLKNTKYETASTSRHDFGKIYSENGENFIKLNLQVRFRW